MGGETQFFRANRGAVLCNVEGRVLAFERADVPGAWQLPQGGLEWGEEPAEAVFREIEEETGIGADRLELLDRHPALLAYELPGERAPREPRGQVQYWFYLRLLGDAPGRVPDGEFRAVRWMDLGELAAHVPAFRRPVYEALATYFEAAIRARLER